MIKISSYFVSWIICCHLNEIIMKFLLLSNFISYFICKMDINRISAWATSGRISSLELFFTRLIWKVNEGKNLNPDFSRFTWLSFLQVGYYNLESVILYKNTHVMQKHTLFLPWILYFSNLLVILMKKQGDKFSAVLAFSFSANEKENCV